MYKQIISHSESLQRKLASYDSSLGDTNYISELISFENTCSQLAKAYHIKLDIHTPQLLNISPDVNDTVSVKNTAVSVLNLIDKQQKEIEYLKNEKERIGKLQYDASETCFKNKEIIITSNHI